MDEARKPKFTLNTAPVSANHDWLLDVVADLEAYAKQNNLTQVHASAIDMLDVARKELLRDRQSNSALIMPFDSAPRSIN